MAAVRVWIEETLCKCIEVDVPENMNVDERMEYAEKLVVQKYKNNEIVLSADDFTGASCSVEDMASGTETDWSDI